jgi:hypothetical protein
MRNISKRIAERIQFLEKIIKEKRSAVRKAPKGILNIAHSRNRVQYYYKSDSKDKKRKYIKNDQKALITALCQKDYDENVLIKAEKEYKLLNKLYEFYKENTCEDVYERLNPDRKQFVAPIVLSDEEFISQWLTEGYEKKRFAKDMPEYYTDNGERVRSKSEILIANLLKKYGIPYKYEAPLFLKEYGTIHPDFTVLNVRKRKVYYFEHMGKMDDAEYVEKALIRIEMYEKNGIYPGTELLLSHETSKHPLNLRNLEYMIEKYLI